MRIQNRGPRHVSCCELSTRVDRIPKSLDLTLCLFPWSFDHVNTNPDTNRIAASKTAPFLCLIPFLQAERNPFPSPQSSELLRNV